MKLEWDAIRQDLQALDQSRGMGREGDSRPRSGLRGPLQGVAVPTCRDSGGGGRHPATAVAHGKCGAKTLILPHFPVQIAASL